MYRLNTLNRLNTPNNEVYVHYLHRRKSGNTETLSTIRDFVFFYRISLKEGFTREDITENLFPVVASVNVL